MPWKRVASWPSSSSEVRLPITFTSRSPRATLSAALPSTRSGWVMRRATYVARMMATIRPTATPAATRPITFFQALFTSASGLASTTAPMGWSPSKIGAPTPMYVVLAPRA